MTATSITLETGATAVGHHEAWGHGEEHDRAGINRAGLLLFMASEAMLFVAMAAARFYLAGTEKAEVNIGLGLVMTAILLVSSWLGYGAVRAISHGNRRGFVLRIALAILMGILFLSGVAIEWTTAEFSISEPYGTAFYAMTGLHVFHLLQGLLGLSLLLWLGIRGHFGPGDHWGATATVRFWTFVDVMWLVIVFPVLYLL